MKRKLLSCLEGKGRPVRKKPKGPKIKYSDRTCDTRDTFSFLGPVNKRPASRYLNFLMLMEDSGRAVTLYDLDQLDTGIPPTKDLNSSRSKASARYIPYLKKLIAQKYIRKLQYGRKLKGKGRPYSLYIILDKGRVSVKHFRDRCLKSPYYEDTLTRLLDEKECIYSRKPYVPRPLKVPPQGSFFSSKTWPKPSQGVNKSDA